MKKALVTGGTGFIGSHLIRRLKEEGYWVRCVDIRLPREWDIIEADEFLLLDLRGADNARRAVAGMDWVFNLAANMGGMGHISKAHAEIIRDNTLISTNMIEAARLADTERFFYSSSACIYPLYLQEGEEAPLLREENAYPANPQDAYGWEKLHAEHLCKYYCEAGWLDTRTARFHNIYGPRCTWRGGREKAPAALCRKIAVAKLSGNPEIEIWGDGEQQRSFTHIDDCNEGILRLMQSGFSRPLNFGRDRVVTINELADMIARIAKTNIEKKYVEGPQGVRSRNSDNSLCKEVLDWVPSIPLEEGLVSTYKWVEGQVNKCFKIPSAIQI